MGSVLTKLMAVIAFIITTAFGGAVIIRYWVGHDVGIYLILGVLVLIVLSSLLLRLNSIRFGSLEIKFGGSETSGRPVEDDVLQATEEEIEKDKLREEATLGAQDNNMRRLEDPQEVQIEKKEEVRKKVLEAYSSEDYFESSKDRYRPSIKLSLSNLDSIANVDHILFDGFYTDRKRKYFILVLFSSALFSMLKDRYYRVLRIIKDASDSVYHNRIILKVAYVKSGKLESDDRGFEQFKEFFRPAIETGNLEVDVFDENGEKLDG